MKRFTWLLALALLLIPGGCREKKLLPNPIGAPGSILVILEKSGDKADTLWHSVQSVLAVEYPLLPQPEPTFSLVKLPSRNFKGVQAFRNILLLKINKAKFPKPKMLLRYDAWASPQVVLTLAGPSASELSGFILKERERVVAIFEQAERNRYIAAYSKLKNSKADQLLRQKFGISLTIPTGYRINKTTGDFVWMSKETPFTSQGILVYSYPYKGNGTFTKSYLVEKRDAYTRRHIPGPSNGSYMTTGRFYEPQITQTAYNNRHFTILRGLWDVKNDYMGGPFISISTLDEKNNRVITVEGYVYAPKDEKRNFIRQAESILYSFKLQDSSK